MSKQNHFPHHNNSVEALFRVYEQDLRDIRNSYSAPNRSANDLRLSLKTYANNLRTDFMHIVEFLTDAWKCENCGEIYPNTVKSCENCERIDSNYDNHYNGPVLP